MIQPAVNTPVVAMITVSSLIQAYIEKMKNPGSDQIIDNQIKLALLSMCDEAGQMSFNPFKQKGRRLWLKKELWDDWNMYSTVT